MPADESQPQPRQLPFESESSDQEVVAPARSVAARVPRARAAALLAVAAAALLAAALLAVAGRSAGAATGAGREAIVSMGPARRRLPAPAAAGAGATGECSIFGYSNLVDFAQSQGKPYLAEPGWIWLVNSSTVQVQGLMAEKNIHTCVTEVTIGGPMLHGGVVYIAKHETTWYPPSGSKEVILDLDEEWSLPGIVEASVGHFGNNGGAQSPMHIVTAKVGDFQLVVDQWDSDSGSGSTTAHCMNIMKLIKPLESGETGLCVNAEAPAGTSFFVSDADTFAIHHSPSPSGDTMDEVDSAGSGSSSSASSNSSGISSNSSGASSNSTASLASSEDKSGTGDTLLYFALPLGFANSIVPFVL